MNTDKPQSPAHRPLAILRQNLPSVPTRCCLAMERPQLSKRDRSLVTCAALVATGKTEQMNRQPGCF